MLFTLSETQPVVVMFVGLLAKPYKAQPSLSGIAACRWYINPDVPEFHEFIKSFKDEIKPIVRTAPASESSSQQQWRPEPQLKTLAEIKAYTAYDFPPEGFRCTVTLTKLNETQSWWFPSCNRCNRTVLLDGDGYKCPHDQCAFYKFKYGTDGTKELEFVFFDDAGRSLIGKDVKQMLRNLRSSSAVPPELAAQIGHTYQLVINVTSKAYYSDDYSNDVRCVEHTYGKRPLPRPALVSPPPSETSQVLDSTTPQELQVLDAATPPASVSSVQDSAVTSDKIRLRSSVKNKASVRNRLFSDDDRQETAEEQGSDRSAVMHKTSSDACVVGKPAPSSSAATVGRKKPKAV